MISTLFKRKVNTEERTDRESAPDLRLTRIDDDRSSDFFVAVLPPEGFYGAEAALVGERKGFFEGLGEGVEPSGLLESVFKPQDSTAQLLPLVLGVGDLEHEKS